MHAQHADTIFRHLSTFANLTRYNLEKQRNALATISWYTAGENGYWLFENYIIPHFPGSPLDRYCWRLPWFPAMGEVWRCDRSAAMGAGG